MFKKTLFLLLICFSVTAQKKPNLVYILADDLGYGEVGVNGQRLIETPNIDALAKSGMNFSQHYAGAPVCAPSRCVLLTGRHLGNAYIRGNDEWAERGEVWNLKAMDENPALEGQRPLPDSILTVAEILQDNGYQTGLFGKWGLGAPMTESTPDKQGFDYFFGYNCQRQAHTLFPMHLWQNEERYFLNNKFVDLHQKLPEGLDPNDPASYSDYQLTDYAPEVIHQKALDFLNSTGSEPFFLYYASPLPHVPLQAPEKWVNYYQKKFGPEEPYSGNYYPNRTPRATYAAMISYLDEQVGDLVAALKAKGQLENTLIIFSSDNGPSYAGGVQPDYFNSGGIFQEKYGRGKGFVYEGGLRVPMIASWPEKIKPGSTSNHVSSFYDFLPTVCDLLKIQTPETDGISFLPEMMGKKQKSHKYLYWEFPEYEGQQAIRMGDWKAIRQNIKKGNLEIELYNLKNDPEEMNNLVAEKPKLVKEMEELFRLNHHQSALTKFRMRALGDDI